MHGAVPGWLAGACSDDHPCALRAWGSARQTRRPWQQKRAHCAASVRSRGAFVRQAANRSMVGPLAAFLSLPTNPTLDHTPTAAEWEDHIRSAKVCMSPTDTSTSVKGHASGRAEPHEHSAAGKGAAQHRGARPARQRTTPPCRLLTPAPARGRSPLAPPRRVGRPAAQGRQRARRRRWRAARAARAP